MKIFQLTLIAFFIILSQSDLFSLENSSSIKARGFLIDDLLDFRIEKNNNHNILDGGVGAAAEYQFKILDNTYLGLQAGYSRFKNENSIDTSSNKKLRVTAAELFITASREFVVFDGYNLSIGIGGGVVGVNTNETTVTNIDENNPRRIYSSEELFNSYTFALNIRGGAMVPIGGKFFSTLDLDANILFADHIGVMPRIGIGFGYWLD